MQMLNPNNILFDRGVQKISSAQADSGTAAGRHSTCRLFIKY